MQGSARIDELRQKFHENPRRYFAPLANEYRKAGDPEQAIAICRAHLAQQPGHMSGHVVYAQALYDAERVDESKIVFEKALSLDPDNSIVLKRLGDISRQRGDSQEARHWYSRAIEADPSDRETAAYIAELTEPLIEDESGAKEQVIAAPPEQEAAQTKPEEAAASAEQETQSTTPAADERSEPDLAQAASTSEAPAQPHSKALHEFEFDTDEFQAFGQDAESEQAEANGEGAAESETAAASSEPDEEGTQDKAQDETLDHPDDLEDSSPVFGSPFVTRTMADLYLKQGYTNQALEVYRQLAQANPNDEELAAKVRELSVPEPSAPEPVAEAPAAEPEATAPVEASHPVEFTEPLEAIEPMATVPGFAANEFSEPDDEFGGLDLQIGNDIAFGGDIASPKEPSAAPVHFTDTEIETGEEWNADAWAAALSATEEPVVPFEFVPDADLGEIGNVDDTTALEETMRVDESTEILAVPAHEAAPETEDQAETQPEGEQTAVGAEPSSQTPERTDESLTAETEHSGEFAAVSVPAGVLNDTLDEVGAEHFAEAGEESAHQIAESAPGDDEATLPQEHVEHADSATSKAAESSPKETEAEHFVAYSPQPPDDDDLPHYTPPGPTIREFFATLGTRRPPESRPAQFTAHAAIPAVETEQYPEHEDATAQPSESSSAGHTAQSSSSDAFPLATDAFANLFPDSPVSEEDTRAAFALSGALGGHPAPSPMKPASPPPQPTVRPDVTPAAQESEEDIRRFREWLDGLAES